MSGTELRGRNLIANPRFFARGQASSAGSRVRIVAENRGRRKDVRTSGSDPDFPVPAFLQQRGFTYLGLLIIITIMGFGLSAIGELYSHAAQREKERELLFIGNQYRQAIASYYNRSPGAKVFPQKLEDLLEDKRFPMPQHHLRKLFRDPMTGSTEWGLVEAPGVGIMGVYSRSEETPIKTSNFAAIDAAFEGAEHYRNWMFIHSPAGLGQGVVRDRSR
jgi:type II secretory pathway pseudopilin PulG